MSMLSIVDKIKAGTLRWFGKSVWVLAFNQSIIITSIKSEICSKLKRDLESTSGTFQIVI